MLTSPPYGPSVHGQVKAIGIRPVEKSHDRYSTDRANLAHQPHHALVDGFTDILTKSRRLLDPGGVVAVTARPYRRAGLLVDIPGEVIRAGHSRRTRPFTNGSCACSPASMTATGSSHTPRSSNSKPSAKPAAAAHPLAVIAHEDLLIFRDPTVQAPA